MLGPNITSTDFNGLECYPHYLEKKGSTITSRHLGQKQGEGFPPTLLPVLVRPVVTPRRPSVSQQFISGNYSSLFSPSPCFSIASIVLLDFDWETMLTDHLDHVQIILKLPSSLVGPSISQVCSRIISTF